MDDYSLLAIFDFLDYGDLANIAASNERCQQLIIRHYINHKYNLNGAKVAIVLSQSTQETHVFYTPSDSCNSAKLTTGHNEMLSSLKAFCHLFDTLTITTDHYYPADNNLMESVAQATSNHCSKIPQKIDITMDRENVQFKFPHAANVELRSPERYRATDLIRIFPRMEELKIHINRRYSLNKNFPHLRSFEAIEEQRRLFDLETFGRHNSQLRSIKVSVIFKQIQQVNKMFPALESLHLRLLDDTFNDSVKIVINF